MDIKLGKKRQKDKNIYCNIIFHRITKYERDIKDTYEITISQFLDIVKFVRNSAKKEDVHFNKYRFYFDDGDDSFLRRVLPLLHKHEYVSTTLAITTGFVEGKGFLDWDDLRGLMGSGINIASHGVSHSALAFYVDGVPLESIPGGEYKTSLFGHTSILSEQEIIYQLNESKNKLEENQFNINEFVLPHGCYNKTVLDINKKNKIYKIISTCDEYLDSGNYLRPRVLTRNDQNISDFKKLILSLKENETRKQG